MTSSLRQSSPVTSAAPEWQPICVGVTTADLELGDELRAFVGQIDCPTKVLRGTRSKVISPEAAAQLAGLIPGATWAQVPDAAHTFQSSNPIGLAAEITQFLAAVNEPTLTE
jgi:pimeloyl-ACP methyl ester carboxylesterase